MQGLYLCHCKQGPKAEGSYQGGSATQETPSGPGQRIEDCLRILVSTLLTVYPLTVNNS